MLMSVSETPMLIRKVEGSNIVTCWKWLCCHILK